MSHDLPRDSRFPRRSSLETVLSLVLCLAVALGSMALIETDRRISKALIEIPIERGADEPRREETSTGAPPRLVCIVTLEGLRTDALVSAPRLRALAEGAVSFTTVGAQATHPLVSLKSLLTGKYPSSLILEETRADLVVLATLESPSEFLERTFRDVDGTLAACFGRAGYRTAAITDGGWVTADNGFATGFGTFEDSASDLFDAVRRATSRTKDLGSMPSLIYLHSRHLSGARDAEHYGDRLAELDQALGDWFDSLRTTGPWDESLLLVTGDFGQSLDERELPGAGDLYLEQLLVPCVLKLPVGWRVASRVVQEPIELIDVLPSLLAFSHRAAPADIDGASFLPALLRGVRSKEFLVAQTTWTPAGASAARRSVVDPGNWQVIHDAANSDVEFFLLSEDPTGRTSTTPTEDQAPAFVRRLLAGIEGEPGSPRNAGDSGGPAEARLR